MRILTVLAHPARKSFNRALHAALLEVAEEKGHLAEVCDLYAMGFNPVLTEEDMESFNRGRTPADIAAVQEQIFKADVVALVHPVWWFGVPAILKGWVDRVFSYGFAYGHDSRGVKPLLSGKKLIIASTAGAAERSGYRDNGFGAAMTLLNDVGIFEFVGFEIILRRVFYGVPAASDEERRGMLDDFRSDLSRIL